MGLKHHDLTCEYRVGKPCDCSARNGDRLVLGKGENSAPDPRDCTTCAHRLMGGKCISCHSPLFANWTDSVEREEPHEETLP